MDTKSTLTVVLNHTRTGLMENARLHCACGVKVEETGDWLYCSFSGLLISSRLFCPLHGI